MDDPHAGDAAQLGLFDQPAAAVPTVPGLDVSVSMSRSILTKATGFMDGYDFTLNPYQGCSFGCTYCYAAFFTHDHELTKNWGQWVVMKREAADAIRNARRDLRGKSIYMSSTTDPYQPIERHTEITRGVLEALVNRHPKLIVQTRSPLVTRDVDLLKRFDDVRVNVTVTTDDEAVRKAFEPTCPSNPKRLQAARELVDAGVEVHITMTPLLPVRDPQAFASMVAATGASKFVVQPFHTARGQFVAGTRESAVRITEELGWDESAYLSTVHALRAALPNLHEGKAGFAP